MKNFKPRIFIAKDGIPYMAKNWHGELWIFYLNPDKKIWVSLRKIGWDKAHLITDNLSKFEQSLYPKIQY